MSYEQLCREAKTRIVAGELPSSVLRSMLELSPAPSKSELASVLADAFDERALWYFVLRWKHSPPTDAHDTEFNIQVVAFLRHVGVSIPWTAEYCESESDRIRPVLEAEQAAEHQAAIEAVSYETLAEKISALPGQIQCVQALWDGDTSGWFLCLSAMVIRGEALEEHHLGVVKFGTDARLFNQAVPPWPEAQHANEVGAALAAQFKCAFYFPSPDKPDDSCPPWPPPRRVSLPSLASPPATEPKSKRHWWQVWK